LESPRVRLSLELHTDSDGESERIELAPVPRTSLGGGSEQRELGRRVLARMLAGNAETFTAMATIMAQTAGKGLSAPAIRARVALVTELPIAHGIADGPLALALVSRREYAREWVAAPSTRSLPARRLAAKILERAAREAARRAQMGDSHALRVFVGDTVRVAYNRLLADRESLVWRYVVGVASRYPELSAFVALLQRARAGRDLTRSRHESGP